MLSLARCGRHADADAVARKLVEATPADSWICYNAACCYALCAAAVAPGKPDEQLNGEEQELRQQYINQSVAAVQQSVQNGWRDAMSLTTDPDLDPVRSTREFLDLVEAVNQLTPGVSQEL
jgi:flagellar biosynthesis/type III secretory pathway protein FliH